MDDAERDPKRLRVSLRLKAGRWLAGGFADQTTKAGAAPVTTAALASRPPLRENGITRNRIEDIEQLKVDARPVELQKLAEALELPTNWFSVEQETAADEAEPLTTAILAELQQLARSVDELRGDFTRSERERDRIVRSLGEMRSLLQDRLALYAETGLEQDQKLVDEDDQKRGEDPPTP